MSDVSKRVEALSAGERSALVMRLRRKAGATEAGAAVDHAIPLRPPGVAAPLSFAQQRLWFLHQLEPANTSYNLPLFYRLTGPLSIAALEGGLNEIIRRHEILRTTFTVQDGRPVQSIVSSLVLALPVIDLREVTQGEREAEASRRVDEEVERPFSLEHGPLLRVTLLKLRDDEHLLLLVMHHIVSDGWSTGLLTRELTTLYEAFSLAQTASLPELPIQYADFAAWQREWLSGEVLEQQLAYWKQQLSGELPMLELPLDRPRPSRMTYRGADQYLDIPQSLTKKLNELSRQEGATLFMTLLAAFLTLLHRYTSQPDLIIGTPIAGRNRAEIENLIGFFVNTLVLRTNLSGNPSFRQLLARVREVALGAYAHQDLPFEKLVEELEPKRDLSRHPFFQVMFNLQTAAAEEAAPCGLTFAPEDTGTQIIYDLEFHLWVVPEGIAGPLIYNVELFDASTIERLLKHFAKLLESIVETPDAPLSGLRLLSVEEERQLLFEWSNETRRDYPRQRCIHQLFEEQAALMPEKVAVVCGNHALTYGELNAKANQLAHHLRSMGVGTETLVGLLLERSIEMVVALLGVLKAGGAYLPLDTNSPMQRLRFMLEDAGVRLLLTEQRRGEALRAEGLQVVSLDANWESINRQSTENPVCTTSAENLAYVMYTSGSTGQPKGVSIPHRGVVRLVRQTNYADLNSQEVFLQFAPLAFDASTFEIWGSLLSGARLAIMPAGLPSLAELGRIIKRHQVTVLWLTSGLFHQMVESHLAELLSVRQVLAGGDVLSVSHVEKFLRAAGAQNVLVNGYGPTENTTFTSCHRMTARAQLAGSVPIGRPVANTQAYILDGYLQLVAVGVVGEIYVGGDGLARGYHQRAGLTAERFVPHPFSAEAGARLYRTGDLARYLPDGNIEFLGRIDEQVKIRGSRIEPGEIESVLREHEQAREVVVVAREDAPGEKRLVAYIVPQPEAVAASCDWRAFLKERLPEYMLPAAFGTLDALPLTPHGKLNRHALPPPETIAPADAGLIAPRTTLEETIASIWRQVLGVQRVGVESNFFELGGHSLQATLIMSHVRERCGVEIPLRVLFELPTIAALAHHVEMSQPEQTELGRLSLMLEKLEHISEDEVRRLLALTESERNA